MAPTVARHFHSVNPSPAMQKGGLPWKPPFLIFRLTPRLS
jgi:hypothetical protein